VAYDETTSNEALQDDVDALDEARDVVLARATQYQQSLRNYHSTRVRPRSFVVGDLVLRLKEDGHGKLESPWLGPYIVTEVIPGGAYRLQDKKDRQRRRQPVERGATLAFLCIKGIAFEDFHRHTYKI
jgi:hypothetical protein